VPDAYNKDAMAFAALRAALACEAIVLSCCYRNCMSERDEGVARLTLLGLEGS